MMDQDENRPVKKTAAKSTPINNRIGFWLFVLCVVVIYGIYHQLVIFTTLNNNNAQGLPVVLAPATTHDVPVYLSALGGVTATYTVTVKTQINGQLMEVLFKEGQFVKKGDVLAIIDQRPYLAQLEQYEGQLKRDLALLANARVDLQRYQKLWKQNSVAQQTLATQESLVKQYEGTVKTDEGLIEGVKVNLIYTKITSPIDGRVGLRLVDPGNFVQTSDTTGIAVVNTLNPITVIFSIAEDYVPAVIPKIYAGKSMLVQAYDRQQNKLLASGSLLTIDNQIDTSTGMVRLRAQFDNQDNTLFPNQFVNIKLLIETLQQAILVPTAAIQHTQNSNFVYVYNNDNTVSTVDVKSGVVSGEDTVITSSIKPGQMVVVDGADKLKDGAKVKIAGSSKKAATPVQVASRSRRWRIFS